MAIIQPIVNRRLLIGGGFDRGQDYGFLDNQTDLLRWRMAPPDTTNAWQLTAASTALHEVIAPSDATSSIPALTAVTGRQQVPPPLVVDVVLGLPADDDCPLCSHALDGFATGVDLP